MTDAVFEGRTSDSPYIERVWRGHVERDYKPVCPADVRWNLLFVQESGRSEVSVEGATTQFVPKTQFAGREFLVIKFKLGVFMPNFPAEDLVNGDVFLPEAGTPSKFWLNGAAWQTPDFENVEAFVERLVRENVLVVDPVVDGVIQDEPQAWSSRTVRRRFLQSTGLTPKIIQQIERAQEASALLTEGLSFLNVAYQLGYADQAHMTRSLRRFIGHTPSQIVGQVASVEQVLVWG